MPAVVPPLIYGAKYRVSSPRTLAFGVSWVSCTTPAFIHGLHQPSVLPSVLQHLLLLQGQNAAVQHLLVQRQNAALQASVPRVIQQPDAPLLTQHKDAVVRF